MMLITACHGLTWLLPAKSDRCLADPLAAWSAPSSSKPNNDLGFIGVVEIRVEGTAHTPSQAVS